MCLQHCCGYHIRRVKGPGSLSSRLLAGGGGGGGVSLTLPEGVRLLRLEPEPEPSL